MATVTGPVGLGVDVVKDGAAGVVVAVARGGGVFVQAEPAASTVAASAILTGVDHLNLRIFRPSVMPTVGRAPPQGRGEA
ncbi:hypothetical protein [Nocardia cyriacigeorgica]|uniref:hypothetical protein n=1 Tax=Nocardia cyriacigeorgica TaxID=135487 RepID=UPI0024571E3A|nr:hypothetical protein [Nocardia cyriacigeorgica]